MNKLRVIPAPIDYNKHSYVAVMLNIAIVLASVRASWIAFLFTELHLYFVRLIIEAFDRPIAAIAYCWSHSTEPDVREYAIPSTSSGSGKADL